MKKFINKLPRYYLFSSLLSVILLATIIIGFGNHKNALQDRSSSPVSSPLYQDFHLLIPALNVDAPIIADVDGSDQKVYDQALENGVAQLKGSAKPGEGSNIFIFGHSSFYFWSPGDYKEVFRHLDDLEVGDEFTIWYNSKEYKYRVSSKKTVNPDQVDVTLPTKEEQVSLMTCVPPGTTRYRLIVVAKRVN